MPHSNRAGPAKSRRWTLFIAAAVAASFAATGLSAPGTPGDALPANAAVLPYLDPSLPAEVRAADLVSRMTFAEKSEQLRASTETAR
ncbi:MAG: hypothetical protein LBT54_03910, partial [Bifidobacteriaceae bacterium]|nr:hypothetical protein [Bifidobacteriaceae bacterium]